jgi:hypothetical protein
MYADVSISNATVLGNKSNNGGAPGATNLGVLPAIANAAAPSYTEGNQVLLSTDLSGALRVSGSISVGGTTDNSAFTAGSSTGTPALGFYHSTIDTVTDGRAATIAITSKRAMMVNLQNASGTEVGTSVTPLQVTLANTGANATAIKVDGSAVTQPVSGTVTANAGTNLNTSALALETGGNLATIAAAHIAQEATTSGVKGITVFGAVTTAKPTYVTGKSDALSLDVNGLLRVSLADTPANTTALKVDGSAVTQPVSLTSTTITGTVAATQSGTWTVQPGNTANTTAWKVDGSAVTQPVSIATAPVLVAGSAIIGKVGIDQTTPGTTNAVSLAQIGSTTVVTGGVNGTLAVGGNVATNVAIGTNPINNGAQGVSSENSAVTTGRMVQLVADLVGKLIVLPYANPENFTNGTTAAIVDTTTTSVIAAQGAGVRTYITQITVTNSHATVGTFVKITDGASTILWEGYAAAAGGGATASFPTPLRGTANTAVNAICVTTGANVIASVSGYKGA